jgi:O-antigen ligase
MTGSGSATVRGMPRLDPARECDASCACPRCRHARRAYRWFVAMLIAVLLTPPVALGFTATRSVVSPGLLVAAVYLPWRTFKLGGRLVAAGTLYGAVTTVVVTYVCLHAAYYLVGEGKPLVFLMEAQWAVYFASFACVLFDVQRLPDARARVMRALLVVLLVQSILGIVSSYTGPLLDVGAWTGGRFGLSMHRATGTLGSPNGFAGVMAIGAVFALFHPRSALPLPRWLLVSPLVVALFLSQSKSGWLSFTIATLLVVTTRFVLTSSARDLVLALGLGALLLVATNSPDVVDELSSDYAGRVTYGQRVLEKYERASPPYQVFGLGFRQTADIDEETRGWLTAHNSYLSFLAELGGVGLLILVAVWAVTLALIVRSWDWPLLGALVAMLLHLYSEAFLYGNVYVLMTVLVLALTRMPRIAAEPRPAPIIVQRA